MRKKELIIAMMLFGIFLNGCESRKLPPGDGRIIAKINNYEMTADDFKNELKHSGYVKYLGGSPEDAEEEVLEQLITKNILIQEAQRENFDKERAFMDEIQDYWEQALLKSLLNKKIKEISRQVHVSDAEAKAEYERLTKASDKQLDPYEKMSSEIKSNILNRKIQAALNTWIKDLRKNSNVKIYKENLNR